MASTLVILRGCVPRVRAFASAQHCLTLALPGQTPRRPTAAYLRGLASDCSESPPEAEKVKDEKPALNWPHLARSAESDGSGGSTSLSKAQRCALGGVGASLAVAGAGGYAWLHWPLLGPTGACVVAGGAGTALLLLAATGGKVPSKSKSQIPVAKRMLELKLLNDAFSMKGEFEALSKIQQAQRQPWPAEVKAALAVAEKRNKAIADDTKAAGKRDLLAALKSELDAGAKTDDVLQRMQPRLFVFDFNPSADGGVPKPQGTKTQLDLLRTAVSFVLSSASPHDKVLLRLTSPGGAVAPYGFAAAQLQRLRDANVHLTVCVDQVAASGGYMMACIADRIVAAPFSSIGSIGVLAGVPNFHKVLDRNEVEFLQVTGGKYKRTVNILTPNTEEGLAKFRQDVDDIHVAFKEHVATARPSLDIERVATGEVWLGAAALDHGLVDAVGTSDEEIRSKVKEGFDAVELTLAKKSKKGLAKLLEDMGGSGAKFIQTSTHMVVKSASSAYRRLLRGDLAEIRVEAPKR